MNNVKIKNVSRNVSLAIISNVIGLLLSFIVRKIFIMKLGNEFVGLNSLFTNILGILSFAELGIGVAITASLYAPLQNRNYDLVNSYLVFYRKFLHRVAIFIEIVGIIVGLFIPYMIHGHSFFSDFQLWIYFFLYTSSSAISYVFSYKRILLTADQNEYLNSLNNLLFKILIAAFQILVLTIYDSYILYLLIQILFLFFSNLSITHKINKKYNYVLNVNSSYQLNKKQMTDLKKSITGMISAKIGGIILTSTDNMIISIFLGLSILGKYSNYIMLISGMTLVLNQIFNSLTPTIGNYRVTLGEQHRQNELNMFNKILMFNYLLVLISSAGFAMFSSIFIKLWLGKKFILPFALVSMIIINFAINQFRQVVILFMSAYGLFWEQRYKSLLEALMNISISILLIAFTNLGIFSVITGTIITNLIFNLIWEFNIVKKNAIKLISVKKYFINYLWVLFLLILIILSNMWISQYCQKYFSNIGGFIILLGIFLIELLVFLVTVYKYENDLFNSIISRVRQ